MSELPGLPPAVSLGDTWNPETGGGKTALISKIKGTMERELAGHKSQVSGKRSYSQLRS